MIARSRPSPKTLSDFRDLRRGLVYTILRPMIAFLVAVASAVVAGLILRFFGGGTKITVEGSQVKKTGKKMVLVAWLMIIIGVVLCGQNSLPHGGFDLSKPGTVYGFGFLEVGAILLFFGSIVAWFQKH